MGAVVGQLALDVRGQVVQIPLAAGQPGALVWQAQVLRQLGKAVAGLHTAHSARHAQGVQQQRGLDAVAPVEDGAVEHGVLPEDGGGRHVVGAEHTQQLIVAVPLRGLVRAELMDARAPGLEPRVAQVLLHGLLGQGQPLLAVPRRLEVDREDGFEGQLHWIIPAGLLAIWWASAA